MKVKPTEESSDYAPGSGWTSDFKAIKEDDMGDYGSDGHHFSASGVIMTGLMLLDSALVVQELIN